jgi:SpoVK/Ycf46/Vps4 family AAA+-type ATPase
MPLAARAEEEREALLERVAEATEGYSGAELEGLCRCVPRTSTLAHMILENQTH